MRKFFILCIVCGFSVFFYWKRSGEIFIVKDNGQVPLFVTPETKLTYKAREKVYTCLDLDTVLLPKTQIRVSGECDAGVLKVMFYTSEACYGEGYVHRRFLENDCESSKQWFFPKKRKRSPFALREIREIFNRCLKEDIPFCYGGNHLNAVDLSGDYSFSPDDEQTALPYRLRGFDSSGLLHFISNGTLPHSTRALREMMPRLHRIYTFRAEENYPELEREKVFHCLRDTDFILETDHVLIAFKGGFIESRRQTKGCFFHDKKAAWQKFNEIINRAQAAGKNLCVVRWHPEVL